MERNKEVIIKRIDDEGFHGRTRRFSTMQACSIFLGHGYYYVRDNFKKHNPIFTGMDGFYGVVQWNGEALYSENLLVQLFVKNYSKLEKQLKQHQTKLGNLQSQLELQRKKQKHYREKLRLEKLGKVRERQKVNRQKLLERKQQKFLAVREALLKIDPTLQITELEETSPELYYLRKAYGMTDDEIKRITIYNIEKYIEARAKGTRACSFKNYYISENDKEFLKQYKNNLAGVLR